MNFTQNSYFWTKRGKNEYSLHLRSDRSFGMFSNSKQFKVIFAL